MENIDITTSNHGTKKFTAELFWQAAAGVCLLATIVLFLIYPILAIPRLDLPFAGSFVIPRMILLEPLHEVQTGDVAKSFQSGKIIRIDGKNILSSAEWVDTIQNYQAGDSILVGLEDQDGLVKDISIRLIRFPSQDRLLYLFFPIFVGIIYLISAVWVFFYRRHFDNGKAYIIFACGVSIAMGGLFDFYSLHRLATVWLIAPAFAAAAMVTMALTFPEKDELYRDKILIRILPFGVAVWLAWWVLHEFISSPNDYAYLSAWQYGILYCIFSLIFALAWLGLRRLKEASLVEEQQIRLILLSGTLSFGPAIIWFFFSFFQKTGFFPHILFLPFVVFPITVVYALRKQKLLRLDYILSRGLLYGILTVIIVLGYSLLVTGLGLIFKGIVNSDSQIVVGIAIFIAALAFQPLKTTLDKALDRLFFRSERVLQDRLQEFTVQLAETVEIKQIAQLLKGTIEETLFTGHVHIYTYDSVNNRYSVVPDLTGRVSSDIKFVPESPLVENLQNSDAPIFIRDDAPFPSQLRIDQARINILGARVFIKLPGTKQPTGWIALLPRESGEDYTPREIGFLESMAGQVALAIARTQVVDNLENRVREMNALSRVSQGINITLKLDDILELIYAQTTQIIPADDFQILLLDNQTGVYNRLFYIVENDRLTEFENKSVLGGQDLEQEIIRQRRPLITDNYTREGQKLGIPTTRSGLFAWMGVPLNAGAEPIGALSLGSRNPSIIYTPHQLSSLQAIADQLAGAIVKARLLEESERRARQLAILNQMSSQLTATLELDPLLKNITDGSVEILNCEAGSLLMVDEQTGDLVFKVTVGPVASNLLGKRLPAGSGVVGRAVKTRNALIINDVQKTPFWSDKTDKETGFVTRSLLVVPIQVQEKVIGVIEVINPRSGAQFSKEDQDLLTAFTAQAAVAIENARLYTMTDQALANRVEELSIMQRIDRELNTSLEAGRTLKITLDWAMNQSKAEAGFVGLVRENGIEVSSWQNYAEIMETYQEALLPFDRLQIQTVITNGEARSQVFKRNTEATLLPHAHSQIIVPIRRENDTMGVIVLESTGKELGAEIETLNFLKRLSDHAAIALSNAQLYAAIQAANLAKSEFVSFVSHELKNPMTSIKGYTELLAAGAVGPVNENQANFLATIRSNVDRMATLVSDLADVSRIEAGRMRLEFKATNLKDVIDEVVRSLQKQIDEKQQTLICDVREDMENLWVDRSRLVQIVTNLISNSNKYSPKTGEISVGAEVCANQWDPDGSPQVAHIWVKDTGIGMKPEDQVKVFQKFFRSEDPKTREAPGTGLGLNITKSLVELQGGKIWFESEFRQGTTFHFTMPIATS